MWYTNKTVPKGASKDDRHAGYTCIKLYVDELAGKLIQAGLVK